MYTTLIETIRCNGCTCYKKAKKQKAFYALREGLELGPSKDWGTPLTLLLLSTPSSSIITVSWPFSTTLLEGGITGCSCLHEKQNKSRKHHITLFLFLLKGATQFFFLSYIDFINIRQLQLFVFMCSFNINHLH